MVILMLIAKLIHRKSDFWTNICLSSLILLIYNPFLIQNAGFILSFSGTIGIILFLKLFNKKNKILQLVGITIFITIINLPFLIIFFHKIPLLSLIIACLIGYLIAPIILLNIVLLLANISNIFLSSFLKKIINVLVKILLKIVSFSNKIPLGKIYLITPNILDILIYYLIIALISFVFLAYKKKNRKSNFYKRIRNLIQLFKYRIRQNQRKIFFRILIIILILFIIKIIPKNLKIHFIDVGQGDSCLIITPQNKTILIDGGGNENYDVGKNILCPYLLDRKIKTIDYVIISHFDTDHVRTGF